MNVYITTRLRHRPQTFLQLSKQIYNSSFNIFNIYVVKGFKCSIIFYLLISFVVYIIRLFVQPLLWDKRVKYNGNACSIKLISRINLKSGCCQDPELLRSAVGRIVTEYRGRSIRGKTDLDRTKCLRYSSSNTVQYNTIER